MTVLTEVRNAELPDLVELLKKQHAQKLDVIAPASQFSSRDGLIVVKGAAAELGPDGVTTVDGTYRPTGVFDEGVADKLKIPLAYVRKLRAERPDLYDSNVNGWLHGRKPKYQVATIGEVDLARAGSPPDGIVQGPHGAWMRQVGEGVPGDQRKFMLRLFTDPDGGPGVARALLSDQYKVVDNFDVVVAVKQGMDAAGSQAQIEACDITDRKMYIRFIDPSIEVLAPKLLENYRNPFGGDVVRGRDVEFWRGVAEREGMGYGAGKEPVVWAGWVVSNSEVGDGALQIVPRATIRICRNGLTVTRDAMRAVHLGAKLDQGVIDWSDETRAKNLELVTSMVADAVSKFASEKYLADLVAQIEEKSDTPISKPQEAIEIVGKRLQFDQATIDGVLAMFIRGGDVTAGGVMQAVTAHAQTVTDADKAHELEGQALRALELAAVL